MLLEEEIWQNLGGLMDNNLINKIAGLDIDDNELEKTKSHIIFLLHT